ncbi:MAG: hypothetical protein JKX85_11340 [Phycisphaeraceae bacterium]|nr:hypothetical protein [Phycisphaeraceae bacterium]
MVQPIRTFRFRRYLSSLLTLALAAGLALLLIASNLSLRDTHYATGWALLGMILFLACYNLRKKLTYPPLLRSATWLQLHLYVAWITLLVFAFHIGFRIPNGIIEVTLATLYITTFTSGVLGIILTRAIPPRLAVRGSEVIYERIPMFRRELRLRAENLMIQSVEKTNATILSDFYTAHLADYFARSRNLRFHLMQSHKPLHNLLSKLTTQDRYLGTEERAIAVELRDLIKTKDALDYHLAMQGILKIWLFIHIPLTYMLIAVAVVHAFLIHVFLG